MEIYTYQFQILKQLLIDKPKIVHVQHELNVYGSPITVLMFPLFLTFIKLFGFKLVVTVHALPKKFQIDKEFITSFANNLKIPTSIFRFCFFIFYRFIALIADEIIVHTHLIHDIFVQDYGATSHKITIIPIGVRNLIEYTPKHEHFFFYMGYMVKRKGFDILLEGFKNFVQKNPTTNFSLVLAGGVIKGQEFAHDEIVKLINSFEAPVKDKIKILGFIETPEIDKNFKNCYAVVLPAKLSIAASGPLSLALSYGKCCLVSDVGNYSEEIINEVDGLLLKTNSDAWEEAFDKVSKDFTLVKKLEQGAIKKAKEHNWDLVAKQTIKVYETN